ncbi:MAG: PRC-barrel domain-containing protein, partial [Beijerinckiaceae bacterium]|nr:PRC-barrel domain-containing protein [Beijerinckiaceae bacterium]
GDIDDILLDHQGKIIAVVVGVGGFLGIGEKNVAIPFDSLVLQDKSAVSASNERGSTRTSSTTTTTTTTDRNAANSNAASNRAANANERAAERANERSAVNDRSAASNSDRIATGNVPDNRDRAATDQDRQRTTAQRAEQMSNEQANRQSSSRDTTTTTGPRDANQRTAQATTILFKPERIMLKGIAKADLQNAPEFHWDDSASRSSRSNSNNAPSRNR